MRTTSKQCEGVVGLINETLGYDRERAGKWNATIGVVHAGFSIEAQSPGDGMTRYRLHYYDGSGSGVNDDCSWSFSLGVSEFWGKLVAFLRGIEEAQKAGKRLEGFKRRFGVA